MVDRSPLWDLGCALVLLMGGAAILAPLYYAVVMASQPEAGESLGLLTVPGPRFVENVAAVLGNPAFQRQLLNSTVMAVGITAGKIAISLLSAFALAYFRFPFRMLCFWLIFITLMLPVEVRIVPTFELAANVAQPLNALAGVVGLAPGAELSLLDSYAGLILPLIASATATFLYRQVFLSVPDELLEAAKIDGAGPWRFFRDILLPLVRVPTAALAVILFVYGWNQYLWPLMATTSAEMTTVVVGVARTLPTDNADTQWNLTMAATLLAMLPPVVVILLFQRMFIKGLVEQEK
jgi:sn-glycerol 3-phosphate transport system permease protein